MLIPSIERQNFKAYIPYRDNAIGMPREEQIINTICKSRTFIIILSDDSEHASCWRWVQMEWKYAWLIYKHDIAREIILVNYDLLKYNEVTKQYLGGFLRLKKYIDFSNYKHSFETDIISRL